MELAKLLNDCTLSRFLLLFCYLSVIAANKDPKNTHQLHAFEEGEEPPHTHIHITDDLIDDDDEGDNTITKTEWDHLSLTEQEAVVAKFFKHLDKDEDGVVSRNEIRDKILIELEKENLRNSEEDFADIDENADGIVTWEEYYFPEHHEDESYATEVALEKFRFESADVDSSKTLNLTEFKSFNYPYESKHMEDYLIRRVLADSDADNDGKLSVTEFITIANEFEDFQENEHTFISFDTDKDGLLDRKEIVVMLHGSTGRLAESETDWLTSHMEPSQSMYATDVRDKWDLEGILSNVEIFIESNFEDELMSLHTEL